MFKSVFSSNNCISTYNQLKYSIVVIGFCQTFQTKLPKEEVHLMERLYLNNGFHSVLQAFVCHLKPVAAFRNFKFLSTLKKKITLPLKMELFNRFRQPGNCNSTYRNFSLFDQLICILNLCPFLKNSTQS